MKQYRILPEYYDEWGADDDTAIVGEDEMVRLAIEWEVPLEGLLKQTEEI